MAEVMPQALASPACAPAECQAIQEQKVDELEFDIARTYTLLLATLILPLFLAMSVVSYSLAAIY